MSYVKGIKANQIKKVIAWLEEGETPARIAKHLGCSVECIKSFEGAGKEVVPESVAKLEPKPAPKAAPAPAAVEEAPAEEAPAEEAPARKRRK